MLGKKDTAKTLRGSIITGLSESLIRAFHQQGYPGADGHVSRV